MTKRTEAQIAAEKKYQAKKVSYFRRVDKDHVKPLDEKLKELRAKQEPLLHNNK